MKHQQPTSSQLDAKSIKDQEFEINLRTLKSLFISFLQRLQPYETKTAPSKKQKKNRNKKTTSHPPQNNGQKPQTHKQNHCKDIVPTLLSLLAEGKTKQAIDEHHYNTQNKKNNKSRFLNGLNHAEANKRKLLWISSFNGNIQTRNQATQANYIGFTPFQYWSQGQLPYDLKDIQEKWSNIFQEIGLPQIELFNKSSAREWIENYTPELIKPFEKAPLYAVEADIFRIAFALKNDCIWIDSDQYPRQKTGQLIQQRAKDCDTLLMFRWNRPWVTNSFFLTKKASPLFQKIFLTCLEYEFPTTRGISKNDVLRSFGPGRYNTILNSIIRENSILIKYNYLPQPGWTSGEGWKYSFLNEKNLCALKPPFKLNYEHSEDSWHNKVQ